MRYRLLLILTIVLSFATSKIANAQVAKNKRYMLSLIRIDRNDEEDGKAIENYVAVFSHQNDSVIVYKWNEAQGDKPSKSTFWAKKNPSGNSVRFLSSDGASILVSFLTGHRIGVDTDIYLLNTAYYNFMKQKLLLETSVLDLAFFLKDGYGDYDPYLEILTRKNWRNQKENPHHKIITVDVKNKNNQTDDQFHHWRAVYTYNTLGILKAVSGQYYDKKLSLNNSFELAYQTRKNLDRSSIEIQTYQNRKTLRDSAVFSWTQLSTAKDFHYSMKQTKLRLISVEQKPDNFKDIARLLGIK